MINSIRGFRDIFHPDSAAFASLEETARRIFRLYGYGELRFPAVEYRELFVKSTGETTDIVEKEMYTFTDAGGRELALRPEGTPGVVRAYLENNLHSQDPRRKLFYIGSMYRAERPQAGRYREFEQIGAEYLGNAHPSADAESIAMLAAMLKAAGLNSFSAEINSIGCQNCRPKYREELLSFLKANSDSLCENCKKRIERNPLRALDCKTDGPRLIATAPKQQLCGECADHFDKVTEFLRAANVPFTVNPNLVRGLDYYSRTVFEFRAGGIGSQDAIGGGGRYDSLVKSMGGPEVPAVGWAMGADRVINALAGAGRPKQSPSIFVVSLGDAAVMPSFRLMEQIRACGMTADSASFSQSMKAQMRAANKSGARFAAILGEDEIKNSVCAMKDLQTGEQRNVPLSETENICKMAAEAPSVEPKPAVN